MLSPPVEQAILHPLAFVIYTIFYILFQARRSKQKTVPALSTGTDREDL